MLASSVPSKQKLSVPEESVTQQPWAFSKWFCETASFREIEPFSSMHRKGLSGRNSSQRTPPTAVNSWGDLAFPSHLPVPPVRPAAPLPTVSTSWSAGHRDSFPTEETLSIPNFQLDEIPFPFPFWNQESGARGQEPGARNQEPGSLQLRCARKMLMGCVRPAAA